MLFAILYEVSDPVSPLEHDLISLIHYQSLRNEERTRYVFHPSHPNPLVFEGMV